MKTQNWIWPNVHVKHTKYISFVYLKLCKQLAYYWNKSFHQLDNAIVFRSHENDTANCFLTKRRKEKDKSKNEKAWMMRINGRLAQCACALWNIFDDIFSQSTNQLYNCLTQFIEYLMNCLRFGHIYGTYFFFFFGSLLSSSF